MKRILIEMATGSGKTIMASELIFRMGLSVLFVVDVSILLNQTKKVFENYFTNQEIGLITEGKQNWRDINIATIQTVRNLINSRNLEFYKNLYKINMCIIDECHISKCKSYEKLIENLNCSYLIGLTGTAFSSGLDSLEIYKLFGFPEIKLKAKTLIEEGYLMKPDINFIKYEGAMNKTEAKSYDYNDFLKKELLNKNRIKKLLEVLKKHKKDKILLICNRLDIINELKTKIIDNNFKLIIGETNKKEREKIIDEIKNEKINIIIGTDKIISKGLDIPELNVLINYTNNNSDITTLQALGRVLRKHKSKKDCFYYDFEDLNSYKRKMILKKEGYDF